MQKLTRSSAFFLALLLGLLSASQASGEHKEFDWSELGVSLANSKSSGSGATNNLRILVSPQRRMSKNYEFDYTTNITQPISSSEASYVIPGSSGSYGSSSQTDAASRVAAASHSSAYSALSASLASLKNRLSARGVTLSGGQLSGEIPVSPGAGSVSAYSSGNGVSNSYSTSLLASSAGSAHDQQQVHAQQQVAGQQPTYLSVTTGSHDPNSVSSSGGYSLSGAHNQSNDNKTIVLAIPAKINFLTDGSLGGSSKQVQSSAGSVQPNLDYLSHQPKQISIQEHSVASVDSPNPMISAGPTDGLMLGEQQTLPGQQQQQQQQYVIVNSTPAIGEQQLTQQYLAQASQAAMPAQQVGYPPIYSKVIQPISTVKYIPSTSYHQQIQLPQVQKVYTTSAAAGGPAALSQEPSVEQAAEQLAAARHGPCLDTCNSSDPRWRKQAVSKYKYCCSRSSEYDPQFDHPSPPVRVSEGGKSLAGDDTYYSYLYRKSKARRSRRPQRGNKYLRQYYQTSQPTAFVSSPSSIDDDNNGPVSPASASGSEGSSRNVGSLNYEHHYPHSTRYYKQGPRATVGSYDSNSDGQQQQQSSGEGKYSSSSKNADRSHRRGRANNKDYYSTEPVSSHSSEYPSGPVDNNQDGDGSDQQPHSQSGVQISGNGPAMSGYGSGDYSVEGARYPPPMSNPTVQSYGIDDEDRGYGSDDGDIEPPQSQNAGGKHMSSLDGPIDQYSSHVEQGPGQQQDEQPDQVEQSHPPSGNGYVKHRGQKDKRYRQYKYTTSTTSNSKKHHGRHHARSKGAKGNKKGQDYHYPSSSSQTTTNGTTDYESAQAGQGANSDSHDHSSNNNSNSDQSYGSEDQRDNLDSTSEAEKDTIASLANKYKVSLNESTVANLSKTTMHLKEILSILEKKTQSKMANNETSLNNQQQSTTPTPAPTTTTTTNYPLSSLFGSSYSNPMLQSAGDFLISELSLKSPYRYEPSSMSSPLTSAALSLPSSFGLDSLSSLSSSSSLNHYGLSGKHSLPLGHVGSSGLPGSNIHPHPRKRRVNKNGLRFNANGIMIPNKPSHTLTGQSHSSAPFGMPQVKNPYSLGSASYYPYLYTRANSPSVTNAYPYRNLHKNPYASLLNGPLTSKLAAAAAASASLYADDSRFHGSNPYDQLANMASSLRPSTTMRLRPKPLVFQPHVLPIYTRHSILTQPLDVKK